MYKKVKSFDKFNDSNLFDENNRLGVYVMKIEFCENIVKEGFVEGLIFDNEVNRDLFMEELVKKGGCDSGYFQGGDREVLFGSVIYMF